MVNADSDKPIDVQRAPLAAPLHKVRGSSCRLGVWRSSDAGKERGLASRSCRVRLEGAHQSPTAPMLVNPLQGCSHQPQVCYCVTHVQPPPPPPLRPARPPRAGNRHRLEVPLICR